MKIFTQILAGVYGTFAFAGSTPNFQSLQGWFHDGVSVTFEEIRGFYSGRCYHTLAPNEAVNSLLGYVEFPIETEHIDIKTLRRVDNITLPYAAADIFDNAKNLGANRQLFESIFTSGEIALRKDDTATIETIAGVTITTIWWHGHLPLFKKEWVRYGDQLVSRQVALTRNKYSDGINGNPDGLIRAGDITQMCHYALKIGH